MAILKTYISQLKNDGTTASGVDAVDILATYNIGTEDFPLVYFPEAKELPTISFNDEDGEEVYIPSQRKVSPYDLTVKFLYTGGEKSSNFQDQTLDAEGVFRTRLEGFINFLYGRNENAVGSRLAIYDEHVKSGLKDITVKSISSDLFFRQDNDFQVIAEFSVTFRVHNPSTKVSLSLTNNAPKLTW